MQYYLEIITCETSIYTIDHPDFIIIYVSLHIEQPWYVTGIKDIYSQKLYLVYTSIISYKI